MIECPGSAGKRVNTQAQRGRSSKEAKARAVDRWGQSPTYIPRAMTYKRSREVHFEFRGRGAKNGPLSGSQNRSLVGGWCLGGGKEKVRNQPAHGGSKTVKAWRKSLKAARPTCWGAVERTPKTAPKGAVFCRLFTGA